MRICVSINSSVVFLALALFYVEDSPAQEMHSQILDIPRMESEPILDGVISEGEWSDALVVQGLHQVEPAQYSSPSQETKWYAMYTASGLFIAARAFDDSVTANILRQGEEIDDDDSVRVVIDAFNNKRSGYSFALNPNGVREDGIYTNGTRLSLNWDGIWRGAASILDDGWSAEMFIPFSTLAFDSSNPTWGVNFIRKIARNQELIAWSSVNGQVDPTVSGELRGFSQIEQGKGLDLIPSVSATTIDDRVANSQESDFRPSLDLNYKITPSLNGLVTINTDFAAVGSQDPGDTSARDFSTKRSYGVRPCRAPCGR